MTPDGCATPGCGHSKQQHGPNGCHYIGVRDYVWGCSCTAYLRPPPAADWLVPNEAMEALRKAAEIGFGARVLDGIDPLQNDVLIAARAVLDAATEVERP